MALCLEHAKSVVFEGEAAGSVNPKGGQFGERGLEDGGEGFRAV